MDVARHTPLSSKHDARGDRRGLTVAQFATAGVIPIVVAEAADTRVGGGNAEDGEAAGWGDFEAQAESATAMTSSGTTRIMARNLRR
jgi:hypothetical protein